MGIWILGAFWVWSNGVATGVYIGFRRWLDSLQALSLSLSLYPGEYDFSHYVHIYNSTYIHVFQANFTSPNMLALTCIIATNSNINSCRITTFVRMWLRLASLSTDEASMAESFLD